MARSDVPLTKCNARVEHHRPAKDWLVELHQGADRTRFEFFSHDTETTTPIYIRAIHGFARRSFFAALVLSQSDLT